MRTIGKMITGYNSPKPVRVPSYDYLEQMPTFWRSQCEKWERIYNGSTGQIEMDRLVIGDPNCFSYQRRMPNQDGVKRNIIVNTPLAKNFPIVFDLINDEFEVWIHTKTSGLILCDKIGIDLDNIFPTTRINLLNTVEGDADQWLILDHFELQELQKQALVVQQRVSIGEACNPSSEIFQTETKFDKQSIYPLYEQNSHVSFVMNNRQKDLIKLNRNQLVLSDLLLIAPNEREAFIASLEVNPTKHAFCIDIAIESDETLKIVMTVAEKLDLPFILVASTNNSLISYLEVFNNKLLVSRVDEIRFPEDVTESISEVNIIECLKKFKGVRRLTYLHTFTEGVLDFLKSEQGHDFVRSLSSLVTWVNEEWVTRINGKLPELNSLFLLNKEGRLDIRHVQDLLEKSINLTWFRFESSISSGLFEFPKMKELEEMTFIGCMDASVLSTLKTQTPNLKRLCLDTVTVVEMVPSFEELPTGLTAFEYLATQFYHDEQEYYPILMVPIRSASTIEECVLSFQTGKNRYPDSVKGLLYSRVEENVPPVFFPVLKFLTLQKGTSDDNTLEVFFPNGIAPPNLERFDSDMIWSEKSEWTSFCKQNEQRSRPKVTDWRLMTDCLSKYDLEVLENLSSLQRLIWGVAFDFPEGSEWLWGREDTQALKSIALPNLTQLTVIYRAMGLTIEVSNILIAVVSAQLTSLTLAQDNSEVTIDQIELEDSVQFTNLRALSITLPLSLEGLESLLSRCPMLEFLAIELTQESMQDLSPLLRRLQSLTQLHLHITKLEEELNEESMELFSEITLPEVRKFSMVVDSQGNFIFIKRLPHMPKLTELAVYGVMMPSQALVSTINRTQTLRHLRLENVEDSDNDARALQPQPQLQLQPQPLRFLSLTNCILPETFSMFAHHARNTLQWLNITSEFLVNSQSSADEVDLKEDGTVLFPQLRLIKIKQDVGPMNPATIVFGKDGSLINGHLLPESVHAKDENESEDDESDLIPKLKYLRVVKPTSAHCSARKVFLDMPYRVDRKTTLNSVRMYRQECFVEREVFPEEGRILFFEKTPVLDEIYQVALNKTPLPWNFIVSMVKYLAKTPPIKDMLFSLGVVECTLQKKEAIRLTMRGESDQIVAISFAGRMIGAKDVSIVRVGDFWCVKLRKDSKLEQQTGYLSYVLQSRWHEVHPVKNDITLDFLRDLINGGTEPVNFFPGLESILTEINTVSRNFLNHNKQALSDEAYEQLTDIELLYFSRKTGFGSCLQRAQAGMDYIQGKIDEQYPPEVGFTPVEIEMIGSDTHAYPVVKFAYRKLEGTIAWISIPLEWGGIQLAGGMSVLEVPTQQTIVTSQEKSEFTVDTKLFSRTKLTHQPVQDVVKYATEQLVSHANSSNPSLLIFDKAADISYFALLMLAIARQQNIPMYLVMTLDELQCVASGLVQSQSNENVLVYQQDYETRLHKFLQEAQKNPSKNYSLVIDWLGVCLGDPGARANYNGMMEHNRRDRRIGDVELPPNVQPISLDGAQALFDPSFLRRHSSPKSFTCDSQAVKTALAKQFGIDSIERRNASQATLETMDVNHIVELGKSKNDWLRILLGGPVLDHRSGQFKLESPSLQNDGDEKALPLVLSNPSLNDLNFIFFIMRSQIEGVHAFGRYYPPACFGALQWSNQVTRHWEALLATGIEFYQTAPDDARFLPLSSTFSKAFIQRVVIGESWQPVRTIERQLRLPIGDNYDCRFA